MFKSTQLLSKYGDILLSILTNLYKGLIKTLYYELSYAS